MLQAAPLCSPSHSRVAWTLRADHASGRARRRSKLRLGWPGRVGPGDLEGLPLRVTGGKTPSEYMFSELPQLADIVRSAFDHLENPLVLRITAFWVRAIPG
jgi:hypothetical protein